jgi:uncharacterized repeat protein (TIGR01451 family)
VIVDVGLLAEADGDGAFSNDEFVAPGGTITYLVTIDNDSNAPVVVISVTDSIEGAVTCNTEGGASVINAQLGADDGDNLVDPEQIDGGGDQIQCTYTVTAPGDSGVVLQPVVTVTIGDDIGNTTSDSDGAQVTTS